MPRASLGARRQAGGGRRDATAGSGEPVRKGRWEPDEDAVLREHVRTHGERDWSSIQSKGLLQRTGRSCRVRWQNRLRPSLKSPGKLSAEEELVVLVLQEQIGNRWAVIARQLEGRTNNDVKNFWSNRQKRLARRQRTPLPDRSKEPASSPQQSGPATGRLVLDQVPSEGSYFRGQRCAATAFMDAENPAQSPYDQTAGSQLSSSEGALQRVVPPATDSHECCSNAAPLPPEVPFDQPPCPLMDDLLGTSGGPGPIVDEAYQELPNDFFDDLPPHLFHDQPSSSPTISDL